VLDTVVGGDKVSGSRGEEGRWPVAADMTGKEFEEGIKGKSGKVLKKIKKAQ